WGHAGTRARWSGSPGPRRRRGAAAWLHRAWPASLPWSCGLQWQAELDLCVALALNVLGALAFRRGNSRAGDRGVVLGKLDAGEAEALEDGAAAGAARSRERV